MATIYIFCEGGSNSMDVADEEALCQMMELFTNDAIKAVEELRKRGINDEDIKSGLLQLISQKRKTRKNSIAEVKQELCELCVHTIECMYLNEEGVKLLIHLKKEMKKQNIEKLQNIMDKFSRVSLIDIHNHK